MCGLFVFMLIQFFGFCLVESIKIDDVDDIEDDDEDEDEEDEEEDEEDDDDDDDDDAIVEEHSAVHRRSIKLLKRSVLNSHFLLHGDTCPTPPGTTKPLSPKKDTKEDVKADLPSPVDKESNKDEGESEGSKEIVKDPATKPGKVRKKSPVKIEKKELVKAQEAETVKTCDNQPEIKVQLESDHDADEEKSGNEDSGQKVKKKKILKKRKYSGISNATLEQDKGDPSTAKVCTDEDDDETESENETKKKIPEKTPVKAADG